MSHLGSGGIDLPATPDDCHGRKALKSDRRNVEDVLVEVG